MSTTMRRVRRALLGGALALASIPLVGASMADAVVTPITECPTEVPCVIVRLVSTADNVETLIRTEAIELTETNSDLDEANLPYQVRYKAGRDPVPLKGAVLNAVSLQKVFNQVAAGTPATFSEVPNDERIPSVLDRDHFTGTFADGLKPAVYARSDGGVGYVRPLKTSLTDVNSGDVFSLKPGTPLIITLHATGNLVKAKINVSPEKITTKTAASFSAKITPDTDEKFKYEWNFTGGSRVQSRSATPTYEYTKRDTYAVNLSVRGEDGSYGRAATTSVKVGKPPKPPSTGGAGGTGGLGSGTGGGGYIPPYIPQDTSNPPPVDTPPTNDVPTTPVDDGLQEVEGFVLAGAGAEEGENIPGTQAPSQPTEASELSTSRKISGAVIGALAVLLLLGLGAEIETRWASTRLAHLRRRT